MCATRARGAPIPVREEAPRTLRDRLNEPVATKVSTQQSVSPHSPVSRLSSGERAVALLVAVVSFFGSLAVCDLGARQLGHVSAGATLHVVALLAAFLVAWALLAIALCSTWACLKGDPR